MDPLSVLPFELLQHIFAQLPFLTLVSCRAVSKSWKTYCEYETRLWQELDFGLKKPVSTACLMGYLKLGSQHVKSITLLVDVEEPLDSLEGLVETVGPTLQELNLQCGPHHLLRLLEYPDPFPQLRKFTVKTSIHPIFITAIVNSMPQLRELECYLLPNQTSQAALFNYAYDHELDRVRGPYHLESFLIVVQVARPIGLMVSVMPMLVACPKLTTFNLHLDCVVYNFHDIEGVFDRLVQHSLFLSTAKVTARDCRRF